MKIIRTQDSIGMPLAHDLTQIIPGQYKGARFKKGHNVVEEDIPILLTMMSMKMMQVGAYGTAVFSKNRIMITKQWDQPDEQMLMRAFPEADIILIEGLKHSEYPKYVCRYPEQENISANRLADVIERRKQETE